MSKKYYFIKSLLLAVVMLIVMTVDSQAIAKPMIPIEHWQTEQGADVYYVAVTQLPIVDINIIFRAGSAYDGQQFGLSSLTNNLIGEGTKQLSADEIAEKFDSLGAVYSTNSGRDSASISLRSLTNAKQLKPALETYIDTISHSTFPDNSFQRVKNQTLQAIKRQQQSPGTIATQAFYKNLYGDLPYGHTPLGVANTVSQLTPKNLQQFYRQYYVAQNATIVIVGDVSRSQAEKIADRMVKDIPKGKRAKSPDETSLSLGKQRSIDINYPSSQTYIRIGELGIARNSPAYFPLYVGNYILGGNGLVSRLFTEVRKKKGLSYNVASTFIPMEKPGPFLVVLQTRNQERDNAIRTTTAVLTDFLKKGPTSKELLAAKHNIIGGFPLQLASNSAILGQVSAIGFYHLPLDYLDTYRDKVEQVTASEIMNAFKAQVVPDNFITVTVGAKGEAKNI